MIPSDLLLYLQLQAKQQFDPISNNCVQFTNECWKIYHGFYYCKDYMKYSHIDQTVFNTALEGADAVLQRTLNPNLGDLVALETKDSGSLRGYVSGFCLGDLSVFLNQKGLRYLPTKISKYSWKNKDGTI